MTMLVAEENLNDGFDQTRFKIKNQPNASKCPDNAVETTRFAIYRVSHQLLRRIKFAIHNQEERNAIIFGLHRWNTL